MHQMNIAILAKLQTQIDELNVVKKHLLDLGDEPYVLDATVTDAVVRSSTVVQAIEIEIHYVQRQMRSYGITEFFTEEPK